jgi:hypothetical protein
MAATSQVAVQRDSDLADRLHSLSLEDPDFWSFRGKAQRDHGHGLMQYPAMMVPQMVRTLMRGVREYNPGIRRLADPFIGSGTVLTEVMMQGLEFYGRDVNPLAVLLCRTKAGPFFTQALKEGVDRVLSAADADTSCRVDVAFRNIDKWFIKVTQIQLSRLRRAILAEGSLSTRRFLWVALAETVRLTSNSRTSTFKLHIRPDEQIRDRMVAPLGTFARIARRNVQRLKALSTKLSNGGLIARGRYTERVQVDLADTRDAMNPELACCDMALTSPPYGDNVTTVPYGQYSYLPLQWIDLSDIDENADASLLSSTHEIDALSLGGSRRTSEHESAPIRQRSPTLQAFLSRLKDHPKDRTSRVEAFVRDLNRCLPNVLALLRPSGIMIWILGNRRVGGLSVPLDVILAELLEGRGATHVATLARRIPTKRMAIRNNVAETMSSETILIMRKAAEPE